MTTGQAPEEAFEARGGALRMPASSGLATPGSLLAFRGGLLLELLEQVRSGAALAGSVLLAALADVLADLGVSQLEVVLEFVGAHEAGDGNAVFLEDHVLPFEMDALYDRAEIDASFGDGKAMNHRRSGSFRGFAGHE